MSQIPSATDQMLQKVLGLAQELGSEDAEVLVQGGNQLALKAEGGKLSEYKVSSSHVVGVRVFKDEKVAISYSEDFTDKSLKNMVEKAMQALPYMPLNPHQKLVCAQEITASDNSPEASPLTQTEIEERIAGAISLETEVLKLDSRIKSAPYNGLTESVGWKAMRNSKSASSFERKNFVRCMSSALMEESDKKATFLRSAIAKDFGSLEISACVRDIVAKTSDLIKGKPVSGGRYAVIFTPDLLSSLFSTFSLPFSAKAMVEGTNPFKGKLGKAVAIDSLQLSDVPQATENLYPTWFDDEGFATGETKLIENGVFRGLLQNSATASELGLPHTANASRSARGPLGVGGVHSKIAAGASSESSLFDGEVFEVISMQGLHSGANSTSGDFSFAASGYLRKNAEITQVVRGVTISGNFYESLLNISAIGDKLHTDSSMGFTAPLIRFEGLTTAGEA